MTTDTQFGTYSEAEVELMVEAAVDEERSTRFAALLVWLLLGFLMGILIGAVAL